MSSLFSTHHIIWIFWGGAFDFGEAGLLHPLAEVLDYFLNNFRMFYLCVNSETG